MVFDTYFHAFELSLKFRPSEPTTLDAVCTSAGKGALEHRMILLPKWRYRMASEYTMQITETLARKGAVL